MKAIRGPDQRLTSSGGDTHHLSSASSQTGWVETPSSDSSSRTDEEDDPEQTIPMEVIPSRLGGRDHHSWSDQVDKEEALGYQGTQWYSNKRRRGASDYRNNSCAAVPFPFSDEAREIACKKLFNEAQASMEANSLWIQLILCDCIPAVECTDMFITRLTNLLLMVVAEPDQSEAVATWSLQR